MTTHQAHYIKPYPLYRQNAHINAQLIKNNSQTPFSNRVKSLSPPKMIHQNGMNYYPIYKIAGSPPDHNKISFGQFKQGINIQNSNQFLGVKNNVVAPPPSNVIKIQKVNRSNSSSRVVSQQSRISYLNVNGDPQPNNNTNNIPAISSPQLVNKNILPITSRPPSNLSVQSRPFSPKPITIVHHNQQITNNNIPIPYDKPRNTNFPISQPKPMMPYIQNIQNPLPKANILNHNNNQMFQHINHNRTNQHRILPNPIISSLDLHTSQVKIVYQRGSYSPNQNQQNQQSANIIEKQRNLIQPIPNQYQIQPPIKFQQSVIKNKQDKISITNLKQEINPRNNQLHKNQVRLNGTTIKCTPVQSIIVNKFTQKSGIHIGNTNQIQDVPIINKSRQNNLVINNKNQIQSHYKNQYTSQPNQNPVHIIKYSQKPNSNLHKNQPFNLNSNIYKQQTVKQTQSKNITNSISSGYLNSNPRYVYKSYDEYLQQTKKPKQQIQQIQQIQQSQLQTVINIQYKNMQRQNYVGNHQSTPINNKNEQLKKKQQINSEQSVKIDEGYGHRSIPIPTIYGQDIDDNSNEGHQLNKNLQNQRKIGASLLKSQDQANLYCQIIQQNTNQQTLFSNQTHQIIKMHNQDYLPVNQNKKIVIKTQQTTKPEPKSQKLQLLNPIPNLKSIRNSSTSNPLSSNNQNSNNISKIRQQTNQYQNDYQYQYSSSLIGSSLQQNLRQVGSSGRLISQYQPDSWGQQSNQQQKKGIMNFNKNYSHNNINNYSNTLLNHINTQNAGNLSSQALPTNKINPFIMIQQQNKQKITKQNIKGNQNIIINRQYQNNIQQNNNKIKEQYQFTNLSNNKKQNTIIKQKITIVQNQQINKQMKQDYSNNRLDIKNMHNFNNQHKNQNVYREYVKAGFHIVPSLNKQQQNYYNLAVQNVQFNNKFDDKNVEDYINFDFRRQDNKQRKYQLSDIGRLNSQKIINISPNTNAFIPAVLTNPNIHLQTNNYRPSYHSQRYSYQSIQPQSQNYYHNYNHIQAYTDTDTHSYNHVNNNKKKQIQNQQQYQAQQPSFDVYDLIDNIYNRQLENGLARIRQVFGNAISTGIRGTY